jgi:hypothetical protein
MRPDYLTYRYPRTLQEVANRYPCNAKEAKAIHGPYTGEFHQDRIVFLAGIVVVIALLAMTALGWL